MKVNITLLTMMMPPPWRSLRGKLPPPEDVEDESVFIRMNDAVFSEEPLQSAIRQVHIAL
jgi:hypothetical protein